MSNIEELKLLSKRLYDLLEQEESGCSEWHNSVHELIDDIAAFHKD